MPGPELSLFWEKWQGKIDLAHFRAHEQFLGANGYDHANTAAFVASIDRLGLLDKLEEDTAFGCHTEKVAGRRVSRDLLDSILEIYFLLDNLPSGMLTGLRLLDVGAGYGRFAHRATTAMSDWKVYNVDAVGAASECCRKYLNHRGIDPARAPVVPLDRLYQDVGEIDAVVNIHSWSECTYEAVRFWVDFAMGKGAKFMFVIPHTAAFMSDDGKCFGDLLTGSFELVARKNSHPPYAVSPTVPSGRDYFLYRRRGWSP